MKGRYFLLPFLSGWTDVFAGAGHPHDRRQGADLPRHRPRLVGHGAGRHDAAKSPTAIVWLLGRIYCTGTPGGLRRGPRPAGPVQAPAAQHLGQALHAAGGQGRPSIDMKTPVRDQVNALSAVEYFTLLAELLKRNPPAAADAPALERFEQIGLVAGKSFDRQCVDKGWDKRLPELSYRPHHGALPDPRRRHHAQNGWSFTTKAGRLRHELHPARAGHRHRPRRQPAAGRRLSDVAEAVAGRELRRREQVRRCASRRASCRR